MIRGRHAQHACDHGEEHRTADNRCRACETARKRKWRTDNLERQRQYDRERAKNHARSRRSAHLKRAYGISVEVQEEMFDQQEGACAVCREDLEVPCVDHCHRTGEIRGLLCDRCNRALGVVDDNVALLARLIAYLEESTAIITDR